MSTKVDLLDLRDVQRAGCAVQSSSIYRDEVRDFDFADRVLALRQRAGLTQRELAALLGVTYKAVGVWEAGHSYPGAERLKQLIALYVERGALTAGREEEEAAALWGALRGAAARRTVPFDPHWFAALRRAGGTAAPATPPAPAVSAPPPEDVPVAGAALPAVWIDWGEAPDVPGVQGRAQQLETLARWVRGERCRLVLLLGEGGIGKTTLAARLTHDLVPEFAAVYWRSLRNAPPVEEWLAGAIAALSATQAVPPEGFAARLGLLLELLHARRGLLVLDSLESVLEPGVPGVRYRAGYEGYGEVLQRLGESAHRGCLLVTSREQPVREDQGAVRALRLQGLGVDEGRALLGHWDLAGDEAAWGTLVARYAGNPLALQAAAKTVAAVFDGDIAAFLVHGVVVYGDIRQLLDEQVARLSVQEQAVLNWLAGKREPLGFADLLSDLGPVVGRSALVEAIEALARRSLLVPGGQGTLTLQPVMIEYASAQVVGRRGSGGQVGAVVGAGQGRRAARPGASGRATTDGAWCRGRGRQGAGPGGAVRTAKARGNERGYVPP